MIRSRRRSTLPTAPAQTVQYTKRDDIICVLRGSQTCVQAARAGQLVKQIDPGTQGGLGVGVVAIIIVVLLVPLVGLVLAVLLWVRRRSRMTAAEAVSDGHKTVQARSLAALPAPPLPRMRPMRTIHSHSIHVLPGCWRCGLDELSIACLRCTRVFCPPASLLQRGLWGPVVCPCQSSVSSVWLLKSCASDGPILSALHPISSSAHWLAGIGLLQLGSPSWLLLLSWSRVDGRPQWSLL